MIDVRRRRRCALLGCVVGLGSNLIWVVRVYFIICGDGLLVSWHFDTSAPPLGPVGLVEVCRGVAGRVAT